jgi:hypothetical protein
MSGTIWVRKLEQKKLLGRDNMKRGPGKFSIYQNHHSTKHTYIYSLSYLQRADHGRDRG